ncbi:MAG: bifunctional hydroxymethylpyrimidine kinase/phosphomethylpyrimidine kinase [Pseudomonadota bacterium]
MIANVLSIAGSDPSGGAGIQADLKAMSAMGAYGMTALTALTAQNTQGVTGVHLVPSEFVQAQIQSVFEDVRVDAVKIGMVATAEIAAGVARALNQEAQIPTVVDPVMIAKGGARLLAEDAVAALRQDLLPLATLATPNLPEAAYLLGEPIATTRDAMAAQASALLGLGPKAVLVKGGHLGGEDSPDCLATKESTEWVATPRHTTRNTHGTGCTLSAALAAALGQGHDLTEAVRQAKRYVHEAIGAADQLTVGHGHGPVHHFARLWVSSVD